MFKIVGTHVSMEVPDLQQTQVYLEQVLGLKELRRVERPGVKVVWYAGLELRQAVPDAVPETVKHVAWQVDDIDEAVRVLRHRGAAFESEEPKQIDVSVVSTKEIVKYIFFATLAGFQGELYQVSPPAAQ